MIAIISLSYNFIVFLKGYQIFAVEIFKMSLYY